ncbi:type IV secretion system protein [Bartonella sp. MM73XJBT]|uniref:type IV secretion system protein n=1 Tax=Bartonella sp. MM73XJBT TaxID=3019095 RepID=UPI00235ECF01|nr:type IV secretion system protein [Bartonella sp. MM73XJBT]
MKRLFIAAVISVFSGIPSYGEEHLFYKPVGVEQKSLTVADYELQTVNVSYPVKSDSEIELLKEQIESLDKMRYSITGTRTRSRVYNDDDGELFFLNPQLIYNDKKQTELGKKIPQLFKEMVKDENYLRTSSVQDARETIDERSQYATIISKAISLHIFQEIENRFEKIAGMLLTLDKMTDLKGVEEMKTRMNGMLAMIQNESTKLQMVIHSHDIEKTLIQRLKRKRNVQILASMNKQMPTIR